MAKKPAAPWQPPEVDEYMARAIKALETGTASSGQQIDALNYIIRKICRTYDVSFRPGEDGARLTDFCEGRRSVGVRLTTILNNPVPKPQG